MAKVLPHAAPGTSPAPDRPRVSLIVLNWDGRRHLESCLASLEALDYSRDRLEIILCDNGSKDGSADYVRDRFPNVRLVALDRNYGFAEGNNRAVQHATGEWIGFLNNDMRVSPDWLIKMLEPLAEQPQIVCLGSRIMNWDGSAIDFIGGGVNFEGHGFQVDHGRKTSTHDQSRRVLFACGGAMLIRRDVYCEVGGFDNDYFAFFEDVDLGWRLNLMGYDVWYTSAATVFHRHHGTARKIPYHKLRVLFERNALFTIYKSFDDANLAAALPVAMLLTNERALRLAGIDSREFDLDGKPELLAEPVNDQPATPNGPLDGLSLVAKAGRVLEEQGPLNLARRSLNYSRRYLSLKYGNAVRRLMPGNVVAIPAVSASHYVALAAFARSLPALNAKRRRIQEKRVRSDAEILTLFSNALFPSYADPNYVRFHGWISHAMGLDRKFAAERVDLTGGRNG